MSKPIAFSKFAAFAVLATVACDGLLLVEEPPNETWEGNAEDCPSEVPRDQPICTVAEGQICAYNTPDPQNPGHFEQNLCGCWEASGGERRFHCYAGSSAAYQCPEAEPTSGSSCFGLLSATCQYPERSECRCLESTGKWECTENVGVITADPPSSVDPEKPVSTLTPGERAEWCDWFATARLGEGYPEDPPPDVDEYGYTFNTGCAFGGRFMCAAAVPSIPSDTCQANLALSTCEAPLSELTDCVRTMYDSCWPSPHGCARYLDRPGCDGTVIRAFEMGSAGSAGFGASAGTINTAGAPSGAGGTGGVPEVSICGIRVQ